MVVLAVMAVLPESVAMVVRAAQAEKADVVVTEVASSHFPQGVVCALAQEHALMSRSRIAKRVGLGRTDIRL